MTVDVHAPVTTAYLQGDELVLEEFRERDAEVVAFVCEAESVEEAVHRCLGMGARVLRMAGATLDTQLVEHRFDALTTELGHTVDGFARSVETTAAGLLDEETGALTRALETWLDEVTSTLDATFDETSKRSAIAKLEAVLEKARREQVLAVRGLLDPDNPESPLAGWRREIVSTVERQGKGVQEAIAGLREQLAVDDAVDIEMRKGTRKGRLFEEELMECLTSVVCALEDVPAHVGETIGSAGTRVGDVVVDIDPVLTPGRSARYVLEAKDRKLSLKAALDELDGAMANRDAEVGVMVFADQALAPVPEPFQWFDHKAIVVLDRETLDLQALRLACLWARWTASRAASQDVDGIDPARVRALLDGARLTLKTATAIRGSHTKAVTAITQAGDQLTSLSGSLQTILDELEAELGCGG